jgi:protein required for attachment to host cells
MHATRTLIVVAAEGGARFLASVSGRPLRELPPLEPDETPRDDGEAGRGRDGSGSGVHAYQPRTSTRRLRRDGFAEAILDTAATLFRSEEFEKLILAAPPKMLGALREGLPEPLARSVVAELDKDLVKLPLADLGEHLKGHLPV